MASPISGDSAASRTNSPARSPIRRPAAEAEAGMLRGACPMVAIAAAANSADRVIVRAPTGVTLSSPKHPHPAPRAPFAQLHQGTHGDQEQQGRADAGQRDR